MRGVLRLIDMEYIIIVIGLFIPIMILLVIVCSDYLEEGQSPTTER